MCVCSVMSNSLLPYGLQPTKLLCPWNFLGKNTEVGCHFLLQGTFLTQGLNSRLMHFLHWQAYSLPLEPPGKPEIKNTGVGCCSLLQGIFLTQGSNAVSRIADRFFTIWAYQGSSKSKTIKCQMCQVSSQLCSNPFVPYPSVCQRLGSLSFSNSFPSRVLWGTLCSLLKRRMLCVRFGGQRRTCRGGGHT